MNPQTAQDLVNMGFYGYQGWSDNAAIQDFRATGGSGKGSQTANITTQPAAGVAVSSGGNPAQTGIQAAQGVISDIKSRYEALKKEITGQAGEDVAKEFGARGIPTSSGVVQQAQGRESARRSSALISEESQALSPFYQMLIGAQNQQAVGAGGGMGGASLDDIWSSTVNLNSSVSTPATTQKTNKTLSPGSELFRQRVLAGNVPEATVKYSNPQPTQGRTLPSFINPNAVNVLSSAANTAGSFLKNLFTTKQASTFLRA